jgi:hypothetical protein
MNCLTDGPVRTAHIPKSKELATGLLKCFFQHVDNEESSDGPEELWKPYFEEISNQTIDAAKKGGPVVLTHTTYRQSWREFVVKKLIEGGARKENITILYLTINTDVKLAGLYYRTKEQMEKGGMTLGDHMKIHGWEGGCVAGEEDVTLPVYIKFMVEKFPKFALDGNFEAVPDGYSNIVDVSGRDMSHLDCVDDVLGLVGERHADYPYLTFDEIRDMVKVVEQKRDEEFASTGAQEAMNQIQAEVNPRVTNDGDDSDNNLSAADNNNDVVNYNTKEELEKIAKRRSSLISVEYLERELSRSSLVIRHVVQV